MDGQEALVEVGGGGVLDGGGGLAAAFGFLFRFDALGEGRAQGGEGGGVGLGPASGFERGEVRLGLERGQDDVGAAQHGAEVVQFVDADLEFFVELHGFTEEGEPGGLARLVHGVEQLVHFGALGLGVAAGCAFGDFLPAHVGRNLGEDGGGVGEVAGRQARGNFGMLGGGSDDDLSVESQRAKGENADDDCSWLVTG